MKRRTFLKGILAGAAVPVLPVVSVCSIAPTEEYKGIEQSYVLFVCKNWIPGKMYGRYFSPAISALKEIVLDKTGRGHKLLKFHPILGVPAGERDLIKSDYIRYLVVYDIEHDEMVHRVDIIMGKPI